MSATRRQFLQTMAGTASFSVAHLRWLREFAAHGADDPPAAPDVIRFGPDIEPIVRLIEETPRARCVAALIEELRRGLPYRRFLSAVFFAAIRRRDSFHEVYKIHSAYQVSLDLAPEERLLPLFWAVDGIKRMHEDFPEAPNPTLKELKGPFPSAENAAAELDDAMQQGDRDRVERALVALARSQGARQVMEQLWAHGAGNVSANGHRAIAVASCWRALETIGWKHAEPVLRFVAHNLFAFGGALPDAYYQPNMVRVDRDLDRLPAGWAAGLADRAATLEMFGLLREGKAVEACELAGRQLLGGIAAPSLWDAIHLATAEMMIRGKTGYILYSRPIHANTSANALHYAFRTSSSSRTRLLVLLQAVAWAAHITGGDLRDKNLRDIQFDQLAGGPLPASSADAVSEIFALVPQRTYTSNVATKQAETKYGNRADADEAGRRAFALARDRPDAAPLFVQAARNWLCRKATVDAHDYKFLAAILEDVEWVSPEWQPHLLAASVHFFHGKQCPDSEVIEQAREALRKLG